MAAKKKMMVDDLGVPPELARIDALREKLSGTDRDDHVADIDAWERKVKKSAILLSLQKHEGIQMILDRIDEECAEIDEALRLGKPTDFSPDGMAKYVYVQKALFDRRELWEWFRSLFTDAKRDIKEVQGDLDVQELEEEAPGY